MRTRPAAPLVYLSVATLALGSACIWAYQQRQAQRTGAPLLPLTFAHADHIKQNCVVCHHNFIDTTGQGLCLGCHKTDPEIALNIEAMFHGLCRDCHVDLARQHKDHGPVRACEQCHVEDMRP